MHGRVSATVAFSKVWLHTTARSARFDGRFGIELTAAHDAPKCLSGSSDPEVGVAGRFIQRSLHTQQSRVFVLSGGAVEQSPQQPPSSEA